MNKMVLLAVAGIAVSAQAQFSTPNVINQSGPIKSVLNGTNFVNHGMVGVGRIPAFLDAQGSTYGSVSSLAITPGSWNYNKSTGEFSGEFLTLPDRGRNDPVTGSFINYQNRIQKFDFSFSPLAAGNGGSQDQIKFNYKGLTLLAESTGAPMVGNDPGSEVGTAFGKPVPRNNGNISMDAEGLVALPNGEYYGSDEYGSAIYHFANDGTLKGVINPPDAVFPKDAMGNPSFNSLAAPATGRRNNQGMEGLSLSPDGKYLFAMNQSAAVQDSTGGVGQSARSHTRVFVYDVSGGATPTEPVGHYVMQLPTFTQDGMGGTPNRTAAQSEILAISDTQFLVLSRDSNGRGGSNLGDPLMYTSAILADVSGATNLLGTQYHGTTPVSINNVLEPGIAPVSQVEAVNMLNLFDLDRFGLNLDISAAKPSGDENTLSEKWEGLALVPDLSTNSPHDYFLFIANDNDFLTTSGVMKTTDGRTINYSDSLELDTMFVAYRVSIVPAPSAGLILMGGGLLALRRRR